MLNIVYAGTPAPAAQPLAEILQSSHHVLAVLTNPPSMQKRSRELIPTPVAREAEKYNTQHPEKPVCILTPVKLSEVYDIVAELHPDILVCFAYGKIFSRTFLSLFPLGGINLHPSLLPLYRGCAPVPAAIRNGDAETGISIQRIAYEMDSGALLSQTHIPLNGTETAESLLNDVSLQGGALLLDALNSIENGKASETPQNSTRATYCSMLQKEDGAINWADSACSIDAQIRAFYPWPGAFTNVQLSPQGQTIKLLLHAASVYSGTCTPDRHFVPGTVLGTDPDAGILIQTGNGILAVTSLQWQTKKAMNWKDFMNGTQNFTGSCCC